MKRCMRMRAWSQRASITVCMVGIAAAAAGCAEVSAVQPVVGGTYTVSSNSSLRASDPNVELNKAIKAATDYCSSFGQKMRIIDSHTKPNRLGTPAVGSVHFRCVLPD